MAQDLHANVRGVPFATLARRHIATFEAFSDVLRLAHAVTGVAEEPLSLEESLLPPEKLPSFAAALRHIGHALASTAEWADTRASGEDIVPGGDDFEQSGDPAQTEEATREHGFTVSWRDPSSSTEDGESGPSFNIRFEDDELGEAVNELMMDAIYRIDRPSERDVVMPALLTVVVAGYDALVGELVAAYYRLHPGALGDQPEFSLVDLAAFQTIEDAREVLIQRRVDSVDRGFEEQAAWFKKQLDIDVLRLCIDWNRIREIVQRRHLVVHTDARVTRLYLQRTAFQERPPELGDKLSVDQDYVQAAIDEFMTLGIGLVVAMWTDLVPEDGRTTASHLLLATKRAARAERWDVVGRFTTVSTKLVMDENLRLEFRHLGWLADKRRYGTDRIRKEVESWDVTALAPRWRLIKLCLLDDADAAAAELARLVQAKELRVREVRTAPIFASLRGRADVREALGIDETDPDPSEASHADDGG